MAGTECIPVHKRTHALATAHVRQKQKLAKSKCAQNGLCIKAKNQQKKMLKHLKVRMEPNPLLLEDLLEPLLPMSGRCLESRAAQDSLQEWSPSHNNERKSGKPTFCLRAWRAKGGMNECNIFRHIFSTEIGAKVRPCFWSQTWCQHRERIRNSFTQKAPVVSRTRFADYGTVAR